MDGRFSTFCDHSLLTAQEATQVSAAEARAPQTRVGAMTEITGSHGSEGCQTGLSIESVDGDGRVIKLNDGSMWEVDEVDTVDSALWLPASDVVLCGNNKMISVDDNESVGVRPIRRRSVGGTMTSETGYEIQASANDETFVINGEVFKAKTYCFSFDRGDRVMFVEGSPFGACASAKLLNLRTSKICEVWCE